MVQGVIYTIGKKEIEALDILEDVPLGIYTRETFKVITEDDDCYKVDLYYLAIPKEPFIPSIKYLGYMIKGTKAHGINKARINYQEKLPTET